MLLLIANFAIFMVPISTGRFDYLLVQLRFDWTIREYSNYLTAQRACRLLGLFLLLPFLSSVAKVNDALVASVLTLATVAAYALGCVQQYLLHLSLRFSVAICPNRQLRKMYNFISICISVFNFEVFKMGFKWGTTVLLI